MESHRDCCSLLVAKMEVKNLENRMKEAEEEIRRLRERMEKGELEEEKKSN